MSIHTNIKEIIKKHGRGIINLTIAVGVSFILLNNPVSVSLLSGDRKPQIRF